jgi:inosose dehydratase
MTSIPSHPRRTFLKTAVLAAGAAVLAGNPASRLLAANGGTLHIATNQYPWGTFYGREGRNFDASLDEALGEVASCGLNGYEPLATSPADVEKLAPLLKKHGLEMRSLYVNSSLHEEAGAEKSIQDVLAIAAKAKEIGTRIIVTNPSPIAWGGAENKNDKQIEIQAAALNHLGQRLSDLGLTLAYHNHDVELRNGAREFHHMMLATDSKFVTLCLDAHWLYRGCGNSAVALFDLVELYGNRITEVHLRQSKENVWSEVFTAEGDIDYARLVRHFQSLGIKPLLVLEQCVEAATPKTLTAREAHKQDTENVRKVFAGFE